MTSGASDSPTDPDAPDASGSPVTDRTAADVFASLAADGPGVDTDAILDGTSPAEIIDRTDEPGHQSSVHASLIDEAELTELILPERRADGSFLWVETTETATRTAEDADASSTFETYFEPDHDGPESQRTASPDSVTAMTDSTETRTAAESGSATAEGATGFETGRPSSGGQVPPQAPLPAKTSDSGGSDADTNRSGSERATASGDQSPSDAGESATASADAAASEIRTTVQYFDHRKPDRSPDGLLASAKAFLSRLFRPGRSG